MNDIVRELNNVIEKYKDKTFFTGELNFVEMAKSCKIAIQDLLQEKAERENPKPLTLEQLKECVGKPVYDVGMSNWGIVGEDSNIYYPASFDGKVSVIKHIPYPMLPSEFDNQRYYDYQPKEATDDR